MVKITGRINFRDKLTRLAGPEKIELVGEALYAGGDLIRAEAFHMISEGSVSGKHHVPSLPGFSPKRDSGVLQAHIETTQVGPLKVEVSSNAPYASALEFGTSAMAARPYMQPAMRRKKAEVIALVKGAVDQAVKG
jgi:HK97 gp10 family phage protein